mmetsp:Transcript_88261/g.252381  ORF Transcript_88261/g.252381 Transcript_88261/m.252381 type:complete len:245 (+) Transcript_88261:74-808(+)|eukprot:CAMPEP_0119542506 /NCGR_PEP_ID=MMETSP1344-20130328/53621_1 /TAXON_ID=236787 /ORGANISM="Florenciella parvula, Strain CCMP2471" /LENGTH=244 /DNA_ID=CAMNT_0007586735 /DNA_START=52 /DNA_END=786 /DNA_ORIENTATION=-
MARIAGVLALLVGSAVAFAPSPRFPTLRRQRCASVRVAMGMERTFIMVKPDGVERGLTGRIISRFEDRGLALEAAKFVKADPALLKEHYCHIADKPFFPALLDYMTSAPVFQMVWKGKGAVEAGRAILGETNPLASPAGTVRGDFGVDVGRNLCHGSDSAEAAEKEIAMWFSEDQIVEWSPKMAALVVEDVDDECVLFNPVDGGCMVEESGDPEKDRQSVVEALESMLDKERNIFENVSKSNQA